MIRFNNNIDLKNIDDFVEYVKEEVIQAIQFITSKGYKYDNPADFLKEFESWFNVNTPFIYFDVLDRFEEEIYYYTNKAEELYNLKNHNLKEAYKNAIYYVLNNKLDLNELWAQYKSNVDLNHIDSFIEYVKEEVIQAITSKVCKYDNPGDFLKEFEGWFNVNVPALYINVLDRFEKEIFNYAYKKHSGQYYRLRSIYKNAIYYVLNNKLDLNELWIRFKTK